MASASSDGELGLIPPETRRLAGLLGRAKTGEILTLLKSRPNQHASAVAEATGIHVATAQRYLKEMVEAGLVRCRLRHAGGRPTEEYWIVDDRISIQIDLTSFTGEDPDDALRAEAARVTVHDAGNPHVIYDVDASGERVTELLFLAQGGRRVVAQRVAVPERIGRFLAHVPSGDAEAKDVATIAAAADLKPEDLPHVLGAVGVLAGPGSSGSAEPALPSPSSGADAASAPSRALESESGRIARRLVVGFGRLVPSLQPSQGLVCLNLARARRSAEAIE